MSDSRALSSKKRPGSWARRIGLVAMVGLITVGTLASLDAEAKRMGGSRSMGRQSTTMQRQSPPPAQPSQSQSAQSAQATRAQAAPGAAAAAPNRSRWLGPIAGLAAGLGIAALLSHFGLGEAFAGAMANFIIIALIAMVGIWLIRKFMNRKRNAGTPAYAGSGATLNAGGTGYNHGLGNPGNTTASGSHFGLQGNLPGGQPVAQDLGATASIPADFDTEAFVRNAKVYFVRLQAAWDAGNMDDIREFTTPEMFAEVKVDLDSRGAQPNQTDVVQLNADLLGVEDRGTEYFASVRFSGLIRESANAAAEPFSEIWNLSKSTRTGEGWLLAGIQQVTTH
ncbi:Tim44-like domain-containing protein [Paraburkholderia bonniea]|uniref:Tim44 domain-containing protein n=1 Tax=Paraburkholderia bonniea TaxID=2152891 RepID=UPI001292B359|nr:Tim44-like domain-containing protein [Paraburkholderia bonniea]WJF90694.1 Tim44-like domain-containing protein [Paraburkholderia bonniea]WJF94007.1 Tim44-like domain-containing protein [Paraburkholderia bonniea]